MAFGVAARAQAPDVSKKLEGFDAYMEQTLKDWNTPGVGVGIVVNDKLVFAKGYGYRDYEKKLPFTPKTLEPIASNSKLFTAVVAGMLVEEGKLTWDKPVRESVPTIQFYNDQLNNNVTLRDMLSHRTGVTRHDLIWFKSPFTRKELFEKLKYLEPQEPMRETFLYNNLMFSAVGQIIELKSGKTWEQFVRERIFGPLEMNTTTYTIADMLKQPDYGVPFREKRDSFELYKIPYYEDTEGVAPAGAIISNIDELSHWLIALMNDGKYNGKQVLPASVLKATIQPAIGLPNTLGEALGYWELLNPAYGMGRQTASYRGKLLTYHGGDLPGFHSQVSFLPNDKIGVIVFVISDHSAPLYNVISYNVYERLLGMDQTPWNQRRLQQRLAGKKAGTEARAKAGADRVPNTKPSHALAGYAAEYENPAYGILKIGLQGDQLQFGFHDFHFPMSHFHYDRFDTPDDEQYGKFSVSFRTNPQGDVNDAVISLDEAEVVFTRKAPTLDAKLLEKLAGTYMTPTKVKFEVQYQPGAGLSLVFPGAPPQKLIPIKGLQFRTPQFADSIYEFVVENGQVKALKERDPSGEFTYTRQ
ncbi:MAG: penicillin-binding protein [Acidobacteria bacterium]|nr:MAG: penicillin-binding protein [Acidobacteria bacterium 13_1_40CM_4_58_4]PYT58979.1 MAG: penicillin-binding protein [Acidobacteriota bacterium]